MYKVRLNVKLPIFITFTLIAFLFSNCNAPNIESQDIEREAKIDKPKNEQPLSYNSNIKIIHIIVALCDNKYQGIVPVPKSLGNGQNPASNLYWGAAYGIKSFFKKSPDWNLIKSSRINSTILERVIFKHSELDFIIIADAYNGKEIKQATKQFLKYSTGIEKDIVVINNDTIGIKGNANLIAYVGHNGLMDFEINDKFKSADKTKRDVIALACYSKDYFKPFFENENINPLVWSTGLMAPEAYIIHDAIEGYMKNENNEEIRLRAAKAYSKYQKCSLSAAKSLLVTQK